MRVEYARIVLQCYLSDGMKDFPLTEDAREALKVFLEIYKVLESESRTNKTLLRLMEETFNEYISKNESAPKQLMEYTDKELIKELVRRAPLIQEYYLDQYHKISPSIQGPATVVILPGTRLCE